MTSPNPEAETGTFRCWSCGQPADCFNADGDPRCAECMFDEACADEVEGRGKAVEGSNGKEQS